MVLEKELWLVMPPDTVQEITFPGLVGDGAPLIVPSDGKSNVRVLHSDKSAKLIDTGVKKSGGFSIWLKKGNPFSSKLTHTSKEGPKGNGTISGEFDGNFSESDKVSPRKSDANHSNGANSVSEDENEDLLADFIDEDSQLPSRIAKPKHPRNQSSHWNAEEIIAQTGSSICLLR